MTIRRLLISLLLVIAAWITVMVLVMRFSDAAPAAVVLLPSPEFMAALPKDVAIISGNSISVSLSSDIPGFGAALYQAGALLVLPAGLTGCLPLPGQKRTMP